MLMCTLSWSVCLGYKDAAQTTLFTRDGHDACTLMLDWGGNMVCGGCQSSWRALVCMIVFRDFVTFSCACSLASHTRLQGETGPGFRDQRHIVFVGSGVYLCCGNQWLRGFGPTAKVVAEGLSLNTETFVYKLKSTSVWGWLINTGCQLSYFIVGCSKRSKQEQWARKATHILSKHIKISSSIYNAIMESPQHMKSTWREL